MRELTCAECGAAFYAVTPAWGDQTCGECIAARVALSLFPLALRGERKPLRRAADIADLEVPVVADLRQAG